MSHENRGDFDDAFSSQESLQHSAKNAHKYHKYGKNDCIEHNLQSKSSEICAREQYGQEDDNTSKTNGSYNGEHFSEWRSHKPIPIQSCQPKDDNPIGHQEWHYTQNKCLQCCFIG